MLTSASTLKTSTAKASHSNQSDAPRTGRAQWRRRSLQPRTKLEKPREFDAASDETGLPPGVQISLNQFTLSQFILPPCGSRSTGAARKGAGGSLESGDPGWIRTSDLL